VASFWEAIPADELAAMQGTKPLTHIEELAADIWESPEELKAFLEDVYRARGWSGSERPPRECEIYSPTQSSALSRRRIPWPAASHGMDRRTPTNPPDSHAPTAVFATRLNPSQTDVRDRETG
jgi:hypothetical protein